MANRVGLRRDIRFSEARLSSLIGHIWKISFWRSRGNVWTSNFVYGQEQGNGVAELN